MRIRDRCYFLEKFGINIDERYRSIFSDWVDRQIIIKNTDTWELSREALLRVDSLLHQFFLPQHQNAKYV